MGVRRTDGAAVLLLVVGVLVGIFLTSTWPGLWPWKWDPDYNRAVTVKNFDRARGFEPNRSHAVCSTEKSGEGTMYTIAINMGGGCRRTIEITLPRNQVRITRGGQSARASLSYNRVVYFHDYASDGLLDWRSPNSGGKESVVKQMLGMSMGQQLEKDLRVVNLRLPKGYALSGSA